MTATAFSMRWSVPGRRAVVRGIAAGACWGIIVSTGLAGYALWACGTLCLDDIAVTTLTSMLAGIATMGPLVALMRPH
jgi:hypothetical protein